jgi:hypothetical protein
MEPKRELFTTGYISSVRTEMDGFNVQTKGNLGCHGDPLDLVTSSMIRRSQMGERS